MRVAFDYRVFLSCSDHDRAWARWLQGAIENYCANDDLRRAPAEHPVFCPDAGPVLTAASRAALEASRFLIVLCSPHAATSPAVDEAVRRFEMLGRIDGVIPVMVAGDRADPGCFPPALRPTAGFPLADRRIDVRPAAGSRALALRRVVSRLVGYDVDEMARRALRARRRQVHIRNSIAAALLALAFVCDSGFAHLRNAPSDRVLDGRFDDDGERKGFAQEARGDFAAALAEYHAGLTVAQRRAAAAPGHADRQRDLASAQEQVGEALHAQGDLLGALRHYEAARSVVTRLAAADPARWQFDLGSIHARIGFVQEARGDFGGALESYKACLDIGARFAAAAPGNARWRRDLAVSHGKLAAMHHLLGRAGRALVEFRRGRDILAALVEAEPNFAPWSAELAHFDQRIAALEGRAPPRAAACADRCPPPPPPLILAGDLGAQASTVPPRER